MDLAQQHFPGDARQTAGAHRRRPYLSSGRGEDVGRRAFRHFAALVEQNHLIEPALLRRFHPRQVHRPGEDLSGGKFAGAMAPMLHVAQFDVLAPMFGIGGEGDHVARAAIRRAGPHASAVAHDHQPQGGVEGAVGFHQLQQPPVDSLGIVRKGHVHGGGVPRDPRPVAFEGEQDAIGHPQGAENSPPGE